MRNRVRSIAAVALLAVLALPFGGCMLATQQDVMKLDDDLIHLRKNQADLVTKMTDLSGNLESLNSQLESSQQQMTSLAQKLDDLQADIDRRMGILSGQMSGTPASGAATTPGDAYRIAYNDYQAGKFDLAAVGFRNLLAQFPKSDVAAQAQFYLGECAFARKDYSGAAREYERAYQLYPKSEFAPKALYKRGVALQTLGKTDEAAAAFRAFLKNYPHNELAKSARDILKESQ